MTIDELKEDQIRSILNYVDFDKINKAMKHLSWEWHWEWHSEVKEPPSIPTCDELKVEFERLLRLVWQDGQRDRADRWHTAGGIVVIYRHNSGRPSLQAMFAVSQGLTCLKYDVEIDEVPPPYDGIRNIDMQL